MKHIMTARVVDRPKTHARGIGGGANQPIYHKIEKASAAGQAVKIGLNGRPIPGTVSMFTQWFRRRGQAFHYQAGKGCIRVWIEPRQSKAK